MSVLHPVLLEKLNDALVPYRFEGFTPRDARLAAVPGKVHAVIGMRRAGKTTYLRQLQAEWRRTMPAERVVYLSFDDDRLAVTGVDQLGALLEEYYRRYPAWRRQQTVHWLLDEVQLVPGWERFVRRIKDSEKVEVVVSGSSAKLLSREVHTSLRGRGMETVIRPFSFREYLRHRKIEPGAPDRMTARERSAVEGAFMNYLEEGGFPEAQGLPAPLRVELLQGYVDTVLFRDVLERHQLSQVAALRWLARHCLRSPARGLSVHRLHQEMKSQGLSIAKDTLHAMMGCFEDAFLFRSVHMATESERRRNSNPRRLYPVDQGLIRAFDKSGRANTGHALETVVLHELDRRKAAVGYVVTPSGKEVDFHVRHSDGTEELVQVCADLSSPATVLREISAMQEAAPLWPRARLRCLTLTHDGLPGVIPANVALESVAAWLLKTAPPD